MREDEKRSSLNRRDLLRLCAAGASAPLVVSLAPAEARAASSWQQGSRFDQGTFQGGSPAQDSGAASWPGGWKWREQRYYQAVERRQQRGEFRRFGDPNED